QVKAYSGGMRRRIDLAASLVMSPAVLIPDQPTTGLDPRTRNQVGDIGRLLVSAGASALLTTQYLAAADQLADRIAGIDHGRIIAEGTAPQLKASVGTGTMRMRLADPSRRAQAAAVVEQVLGTPVTLLPDAAGLEARVADDRTEAAAQV